MTHFNWTPGIGDPTIGGWVTVALYLLASGSCWISAQKLGLEEVPRSNERRAWRAISVLFLALGINKQLDLQTALTAAGRVLARNQGWYEQRQFVQLVFIAVAAMTCLIAAITLLLWARNSPIPTRIALMGTSMVLGFVLIRAASFHHVDQFSISRSVHVKIAREAMDRGRAALTVAVGSPWCTARLPETGGSHGDGYTRRGRAADGDCVMSCCRACEAGLRQ